MSHPPPSTPPGDEFPPEEILLGRGAAWILTGLFLLLLAVPPLLDGLPGRIRELAAAVTGKGSSKTIAERLRGYDSSVAAAGFTDGPRRLTQQILTGFLKKGNDRVIIGRDGWLFYRPEIQALTGYGPLDAEPHSVSRDPALLDWEAPLQPIKEFSQQLRERGVALWLVPVTMKPSIYPERLTGTAVAQPMRHRDAAAFYRQLTEAGVMVLDPAAALFAAKGADRTGGPVYLSDDTHWTSRGMGVAADLIAERIRQETALFSLPGKAWTIETISSLPDHGDLVEKLGLPAPEGWAPPRTEPLPVVKLPDGITSAVDRSSPVVVIGDSFVNIFDDPGLGFGHPEAKPRSQAGLAGNLAARLGRPLDVYAVNGEGASGVRQWLAQRGESIVRSKKLVIWIIAERDLFLSRSIAKANRVNWERVAIVSEPSRAVPGPAAAGGPTVVEAEVMEKSDQADPRRANYENALYTVQYRILKTVSGPPVSGEVEVVHWHFKKRTLQPTASLEPGKVYRLTLEPWAAQGGLQTINREVIGEAAPPWWSEVAEPVP